MSRSHPFHLSLVSILTATVLVYPHSAVSADDWIFEDDRSTPQKLIESFYFAINNRYYAQAYSYFSDGFAPKDFETWSKGYADTKTVTVKFGSTMPDPGAGQIYWSLPVAIAALQTDGTTKVFTGCYKIHLANPGMQSDPPFQPMGINSAALKPSKEPFDKISPGDC